TETAPAGSNLVVSAVYQESARSVWITALTPYNEDEPQQTKVLHWNGRTWRDVTGPVDGLWADAITGDGKGTLHSLTHIYDRRTSTTRRAPCP
ncbi:hypothetical protein STRTUCAR8_09626, partial [Streptomyces turgidiscabies Car8]